MRPDESFPLPIKNKILSKSVYPTKRMRYCFPVPKEVFDFRLDYCIAAAPRN